jgi:hypothetical protein
MNQQNLVKATPEIYVTLDLPNNQRQVIDVPTARAIYQALGGALAAIDAALLVKHDTIASPEIPPRNELRGRGDLGQQAADACPPEDLSVGHSAS